MVSDFFLACCCVDDFVVFNILTLGILPVCIHKFFFASFIVQQVNFTSLNCLEM